MVAGQTPRWSIETKVGATPKGRLLRAAYSTYLDDVVRQLLGAVQLVNALVRLLAVHGKVELVWIFHRGLELEGLHTIFLLAIVASPEHCGIDKLNAWSTVSARGCLMHVLFFVSRAM